MEHPPSFIILSIFFHLFIAVFTSQCTLALDPACRSTCGSLPIKYPFGTGHGCGSPRFQPYLTCTPGADQLLLKTHTGAYPITSISYTTSTITITPPNMSTCNSMQPSSNFGLDWDSPFQIGPSTFILLSCSSPSSTLAVRGAHICDPSSSHLCASIYTCPTVVSLGLPLFPETSTCCVYSPANLNTKGELDLHGLECAGYTSVVSLGQIPTDPSQWEYGVALKYTNGAGGVSNYNAATTCDACERSEGVCGYSPPGNSFVCVCKEGFNTSTDCYSHNQGAFWSSSSLPMTRKYWLGLLAGFMIFCIAAA